MLLAAFSGVLLALAFPKFDFNLLAWIAFSPLFWAIKGQTTLRSFVIGWVAGMCFYLATLYWIVDTIGLYSNIPHVVAVFPLILMCSILSLYTGAFAVGVQLFSDRGPALLLFGPILWVSLEWVPPVSFF